jgi:phospholipase A1
MAWHPGSAHPLKAFLSSFLLLLTLIGTASAEQATLVFNVPAEPIVAGMAASLWLNALNDSDRPISWIFPTTVNCRLISARATNATTLEVQGPTEGLAVDVGPNSFARKAYRLTVPSTMIGQVIVDFDGLKANRLVLDVQPQAVVEDTEKKKTPLARMIKKVPSTTPGQPFEPVGFFKEHIFPYEPFYFVAGPDSPNAKFQVSFKYQLLNNEGPLAEHAPALKGFAMGYTQTSLWDWNRASAPFFDSSYKPELLYSYERLLGGRPTNWFRLDMQTGFQHESNGKDGDNSRSLNIAYVRPTVTLGNDEDFLFRLIPRAWIYLGDLSDNPDIVHYRGYVDLRAIVGYKGLQLSTWGRMGNAADKGSVQLDLTYPLTRLWGTFSVYLHVQYFTGYGESLLEYNQRSSAFRAGFSLYR